MTRRCFFITGTTGLVGGYLLDRLACDPDAELHVLVRSATLDAARQRIASLGHYFGLPDLAERIGIHVGCISQPGIGLSPESRELIQTRMTDVVHVAASISFTDAQTNLQVNRKGTEYLLDVVPDDARFFYVSTAYVGGMAASIREDQLDIGQRFRNDYERSKFETECFVRQRYLNRPGLLTVFRPSIVTGEWTTGRTFQFMTLYRVLRALVAFARRHPGENFDLEYAPDGTQNYIPVDRLTDMMEEVLRSSQFWGGTYHLVNDKPIVNRDFRELVRKRLGFNIANRKPDGNSNNLNKAAVAGNAAYLAYLDGEPAFGCAARNQLVSSRQPMPFDREYLDRLLNFCEQTAWGKRIAICR